MELLKARDWSTRAQDQIDGLEMHVHWLEASRRVIREDMNKMMRNVNSLLELNQQMIQDILWLCQGHSHPKLSVVQGAGSKPSADEIQPTARRYPLRAILRCGSQATKQ